MSEEEKQSEMPQGKPKEQLLPWVTFLEEYPVRSQQKVSGYYYLAGYESLRKSRPTLRLYCEKCEGVRKFDGEWQRSDDAKERTPFDDFLVYTCRDCREYKKHYCLCSCRTDDSGNGEAVKIGEYPELNISIPPSLPKLLGDDYSYFIEGLKCEKQGLGVGAYAYYRRVVENQKNRLFEEVLKVAKKLNVKAEMIERIEAAIKENQFAKAVDMVKDALPESLLVDGHNPFKLLYKALSIGIHNQPDEECLKIAHNIRIVLTDLSERIKSALSEQKELQSAVSALLKFNEEKK
jgi:hypothetical protein